MIGRGGIGRGGTGRGRWTAVWATGLLVTAATSLAEAQDVAPSDPPATRVEAPEPRAPTQGEDVEQPSAASPTEPVLELPVALALFRLPRPPFYETWWFWTAVSAVMVGIVLTVVVAVTTDDDVTSPTTRTDLVLRW